jgi:hypothetical protein
MVDNDLVAAIGAERGLNGGSNCPAGVDVTEDSAIFRVVAVERKKCWSVWFARRRLQS